MLRKKISGAYSHRFVHPSCIFLSGA